MGVIKKLIGGFLSFLGGIFGIFNIFKKSEYYLEADPATTGTSAPAAAPKAAAPAAVAKPAAAVASSNGKVAAPAAPAPEPVKAAPAKVAAPAASGPTVFAPDFLVSSGSSSRRRPGPSLNVYMDMAKKVKA